MKKTDLTQKIETCIRAAEEAEEALRSHFVDTATESYIILKSNGIAVKSQRLDAVTLNATIKALIFARYEYSRLLSEQLNTLYGATPVWMIELADAMHEAWVEYVRSGRVINADKITGIHYVARGIEG